MDRANPRSGPLIRGALLLCAVIVAGSAGCRAQQPTHERLNAVLWAQSSAEYEAVAMQSYDAAKTNLSRGLSDPDWTAETTQKEGYAYLPPAVIVDVDETILNNAPFEARMIKANKGFDANAWTEWVQEARALPIPGALEFVQHASDNNVHVFYVTNRTHELEDATRRNLRQLGFPISDDIDNVLTRNEKEDWSEDKTTRRIHIARSYRVLLLIGDALGDFIPPTSIDPAGRVKLGKRFSEMWGTKWIILPNPTYGDWEDAFFGDNPPKNDSERISGKYDRLETLDAE